MPIAMPRPIDGFVNADASPSGTSPVAAGTSSTTNSRIVLAVLVIEAGSEIGSPSTQWAWSGSSR